MGPPTGIVRPRPAILLGGSIHRNHSSRRFGSPPPTDRKGPFPPKSIQFGIAGSPRHPKRPVWAIRLVLPSFRPCLSRVHCYVTGTVFLVGAGPGDPGLITVAGRDALASADVVVYDRLTHPDLLDFAPKTAERIFVGKESARHHVRQEDTNQLLVERAAAGCNVVRLKGGDPMVFGRGGEEAEFLKSHDIPFVLIPGVTSAIAALTYAGIPITHRDAASSFAVITGHERDDSRESGSRAAGPAEQRRRWDRIAHAADTLVFLMGVENLGNITGALIEHGRSPQTPVAVVQWGTWDHQRTVAGTLESIVTIAREAGITAPAVTVVGDVVRWREALRWFDNRPLSGKKVVVTRAREQASDLTRALRQRGASVIEFPVLRKVQDDSHYEALRASIRGLDGYDRIVFTSANGVDAFFDQLGAEGKDGRALHSLRVAVVGPQTAQQLQRRGIQADYVSPSPNSETLGESMHWETGRNRILLILARESDRQFVHRLEERGAATAVVEAYGMERESNDTNTLRSQLESGTVDAITFASSNTVRVFVESVGPDVIRSKTRIVAIGPRTAQTVRDLIRSPDAVSSEASVQALADTVVSVLTQ